MKNHQQSPETPMEMMIAITNPQGLLSMPLIRFMPNIDVTKVGIIMMIVTDVRVRITVFMLLLMILWYVSIVDSRMFE